MDQVVLHLNSHGPTTRVHNPASANNSFTQLTTMPIKDINKIGLLSGKIPRQMDTIDATNNKIYIALNVHGARFEYMATMPIIDYYPSIQRDGGNVVDTPLAVNYTHPAGVPTVVQVQDPVALGQDAMNLAEVLQHALNNAHRLPPFASTLNRDGFSIIVANSGRMTFAVGRLQTNDYSKKTDTDQYEDFDYDPPTNTF